MCGNNMSVPLLAEAVTVSGTEKETAAVGLHAQTHSSLNMQSALHLTNLITLLSAVLIQMLYASQIDTCWFFV